MTKMRKCPDCKCWRTPTPHYGRPSCLSCQVGQAVPLSYCHFATHVVLVVLVVTVTFIDIVVLSVLLLLYCYPCYHFLLIFIALVVVDHIHHIGDVATLYSLRATLNDTLSQARQIFCWSHWLDDNFRAAGAKIDPEEVLNVTPLNLHHRWFRGQK